MENAPLPLDLNDALAADITLATIRMLRETFGIEAAAGRPEYGEGIASLVGDISGIIGMAQSRLEGTLILCVDEALLRQTLPPIIGKSASITHEVAVDAVGELTNIIFGQVKRDLNLRGHQLNLGIPSVVTGRGHFIGQFHRGRYMIVPFQIGGCLFQIYVALHEALSQK